MKGIFFLEIFDIILPLNPLFLISLICILGQNVKMFQIFLEYFFFGPGNILLYVLKCDIHKLTAGPQIVVAQIDYVLCFFKKILSEITIIKKNQENIFEKSSLNDYFLLME